ncbi:hypothetical protein [Prevotella sp.]|uniref:hypothetical protein n=1 Tax=Prevotella sp. TaxID=59823 RepID=UPI002648EF28|nr:hypothetical protein [Prevotella sp.]MDN5554346.1 hypothetical protein [Prevotella sp.]
MYEKKISKKSLRVIFIFVVFSYTKDIPLLSETVAALESSLLYKRLENSAFFKGVGNLVKFVLVMKLFRVDFFYYVPTPIMSDFLMVAATFRLAIALVATKFSG